MQPTLRTLVVSSERTVISLDFWGSNGVHGLENGKCTWPTIGTSILSAETKVQPKLGGPTRNL